MNFAQQIMQKRIAKLESDEKKLDQVRKWAVGRRDMLDRIGPCITTTDGEYIDIMYLEDLEIILESD